MITTFRHKGLKELFERGETRRIEQKHWDRCREILTVIHNAANTVEINRPGYKLHTLAPTRPSVWSIRAYGAWRITFRFEKGVAFDVDLEQYHDRR